MSRARHPLQRPPAQGFTYVGLMVIVALIVLSSTATLQAGLLVQRRDAEDDLLFAGRAFGEALASYAQATPAGQPPEPGSLQDLLRDPRLNTPVRHLRKIFFDPMTHRQEWGVVKTPDQRGIVGVYSLSQERPFKVAEFERPFEHFAARASYREWIFTAQGPTAPAGAAATPKPGAN